MNDILPMGRLPEKFEAFGVIDLFGHNRLAGKISEQSIGGCHFLRVDVPAVDGIPEHTRLFTQGAIYGISFTSEEVARKAAAALRQRPVYPFELQVPSPVALRGLTDDDVP